MADKKEYNQVEANRRWRENNPDMAKYSRYKSNARTFVRHWATKEDLEDLIEIFNNENPNK